MRRVVLCGLLLAGIASCAPADSSNGSTADAAQPAVEVVSAGVISKPDRNETFPSIDPTDGSLWFSVYGDDFGLQTVMHAQRSNDGWLEAQVAPFSGRYGDRAPRFSLDGQTLYFTSNRPHPSGSNAGQMNLWMVERQENGGWSEPRLLPAPANIPGAATIHAAATRNALYFASTRTGTSGRSDIFRLARQDTGWGESVHLPAPVNDTLSQPDLLVSPDETWMFLVVSDHPKGLGGDDLFLLRGESGTWSAPLHLPAPINSAEYEYGPSLSPDGEWLYFTSHRGGSADIYRIRLAQVLSL